jgi:hypothetical protein
MEQSSSFARPHGQLSTSRSSSVPSALRYSSEVVSAALEPSLPSSWLRQPLTFRQCGTSDLLLYLALVVPIGGRLIPIVGISDLLIGGAAATALIRLGLRPIAVVGTIAMGLVFALSYGLWRGGAPALPFLAVTVFLLVWRNSIGSIRHDNGASTP